VSPERLRQYVLILTRDIFPPLAGFIWGTFLVLTDALVPFHVPLIGALLGIPFVAPRRQKDETRDEA
jgi:hypothetical protein